MANTMFVHHDENHYAQDWDTITTRTRREQERTAYVPHIERQHSGERELRNVSVFDDTMAEHTAHATSPLRVHKHSFDGTTLGNSARVRSRPPRNAMHSSWLESTSSCYVSAASLSSSLSSSSSYRGLHNTYDDAGDNDDHKSRRNVDDDDENDSPLYVSGLPIPLYHGSYLSNGTIPARNIQPSDSRTFGKLFPSLERLYISHDDRLFNGNMSLCVSTAAAAAFRPSRSESRKRSDAREEGVCNVQLFHLFMYDLPSRDFSLRRYGPDSGREVCSSRRVYVANADDADADADIEADTRAAGLAQQMFCAPFRRLRMLAGASSSRARPLFRRCFSSASNPVSKHEEGALAESTGRSRRGSLVEAKQDYPLTPQTTSSDTPAVCFPTNTIRLGLSNYATVNVAFCRPHRYQFEWWGRHYAWTRRVNSDQTTSFRLLCFNGPFAKTSAIAHIVPDKRSLSVARAEEAAGGWVPPCYMWISDESVLEATTDISDVIVATGLIVLVDDAIRRRLEYAHRVEGCCDLELDSRSVTNYEASVLDSTSI